VYYSYTPKYDDLDYIFQKHIKDDPTKRINFFFDVKNGVYNPDVITESNKGEHAVELISAVTNVIQYIKNRYSTMFDITNRLRFFFFCETGKSSYHRGIDMAYKSNRGLNDYLARSESDQLMSQAMFFAIQVLNDIINMIPNAYYFMGEFAEYDYIPYVIYKRMFEARDVGIVFSTDRDMYQLQSYTTQFEQLEKLTSMRGVDWHPGRLFVNRDNYVDRFIYKMIAESKLTVTDEFKSFVANHFSLIRGILGDGGDGIPGIKGLGLLTIVKLFDTVKKVILPRDEYNEKIKKMDFFRFDFERENSIFNLEVVKTLETEIKKSKKLSDLFTKVSMERICKNIALMDYEVMHYRRASHDTEYIDKILNNQTKFKTIPEIETFLDSTGLWKQYPGFKVNISL